MPHPCIWRGRQWRPAYFAGLVVPAIFTADSYVGVAGWRHREAGASGQEPVVGGRGVAAEAGRRRWRRACASTQASWCCCLCIPWPRRVAGCSSCSSECGCFASSAANKVRGGFHSPSPPVVCTAAYRVNQGTAHERRHLSWIMGRTSAVTRPVLTNRHWPSATP